MTHDRMPSLEDYHDALLQRALLLDALISAWDRCIDGPAPDGLALNIASGASELSRQLVRALDTTNRPEVTE